MYFWENILVMAKKKTTSKKNNRDRIIAAYMEDALEREHEPKSIYKFCKQHSFDETEFYNHFGSFESLRQEIWKEFFHLSMGLMQKSKGYEGLSNKEKMLTFLYTFFEMLKPNRSYVLFSLRKEGNMPNLSQLKGLRNLVKDFAGGLIEEANDEKMLKILKHPKTIFSEGAWLQTLYILKYWMEDTSPSFEKTDVFIEKSVRVIFDVFETTPLESVVDFGKFLWKEQMN